MTTAEKAEAEGFEPVKDATRSLPPLVILEVGDKVSFIIEETVIVEDTDHPNKFRNFYRGVLNADCECSDKEENRVTYKKGDAISLPGAGGLDFTLAGICRRLAKQGSKDVPRWEVLEGYLLVVERKEDEKMSKGRFAGKPVKAYKVGYAAPLAKAKGK